MNVAMAIVAAIVTLRRKWQFLSNDMKHTDTFTT